MQAGATTLTVERPEASSSGSPAGVKTILLHVQNDSSLAARQATALSLARACGAHLSCLHVTPIEAYVAFDSFGGLFVMNDVIKALDEEEQRLRQRVERDLGNEDVSWDYAHVTASVPTSLIRHAALADLLVMGRDAHRDAIPGKSVGLLGEVLNRSRTPLFIPANDSAAADPTGVAIVAWDGSYEACNSVRAAVGLLKLASDVQVVQVREEGKGERFPGTRLLEYLSRHGVHAELSIQSPRGASGEAVAGVLLAHALGAKASYMVMGGYNHSRLGEYLFGGVTRTLLADCPLPLFVAH